MSDLLSGAAPPSPPRPGHEVREAIDDLTRILALPRRPPVNCQRDSRTKRYLPEVQALIEAVTSQYTRGPRISCACRPRKVALSTGGVLTITRILPEGDRPEPPLTTTVRAFVADNQSCEAEIKAARQISCMQPGEEIELPPADDAGHPCITTLNASQAWALREAKQVGGMVGFLGVGSGKSLIFLLAPLLYSDCRLAVLLIEPKQRRHYYSQYLRLREHFRVTSIVFDNDVDGFTVAGTPPLHLISYSKLSVKGSTDLLDQRAPDVLLLDEAHRACGENSAINRRVKRFLADRIIQREDAIRRGEPVRARAVRLLDGSGTLESKSVEDTQMLGAYSLGTGSPMPLDPNEAEAWSAVFDPAYRPDRTSKTAKKLQKAFGGGVEFDSDEENIGSLLVGAPEKKIREGFQKRRMETPGVITACASAINAAIYFTERKPPKMPELVKQALSMVRVDWLRPDGDELVEKTEQIACARQVAGGFYLYWAFPKHPCACSPNLGPGDERCSECKLIADWYSCRKLYRKEERSQLLKGEVHLDSPKLCEEAAERFWREKPYTGDLPKWRSETWPAWNKIENRVQHEERVRWIGHNTPEAEDPATHPGYWLARDAAAWALDYKSRKGRPGIVWFQSTAFGRKVAELSGLPYHAGGPGGEERLRAEKGDRSIICSIKANGSGTDGLQQKFSDQLITEIPSSNSSQQGLEQILGRLHREGQRADAINTYAYLHVTELRDALRKAIEQAEFNESMTGNPQKLLCCDRDELEEED